MNSCKNCNHASIFEDSRDNQLLCHRYPPQVVLVPARTLQGDGIALQPVFPPVKPNDFCGEFKQKINS